MGTKFAPTYATSVMGYLEENLYKTIKQKYGIHEAKLFRENWKRFFDDCFLLWNSQITVDQLYQELNTLHATQALTSLSIRAEHHYPFWTF